MLKIRRLGRFKLTRLLIVIAMYLVFNGGNLEAQLANGPSVAIGDGAVTYGVIMPMVGDPELETFIGTPIGFQVEPLYTQEQYDIVLL